MDKLSDRCLTVIIVCGTVFMIAATVFMVSFMAMSLIESYHKSSKVEVDFSDK